jgi:hypothetical protein
MTSKRTKPSSRILLTGLDGSNPLAFLATLGIAKVLSQKTSVEIDWQLTEGAWRPSVTAADLGSPLASTIHDLLDTELNEPWSLSKKLPFEASMFREALLKCLQETSSLKQAPLDLYAAFGSETYCDEKGQFQDTAFRMVRSGDSAGQGFPDYACKLAKQCTMEDIEGALFGPWTFAKALSSFRWDPCENREYALQSGNPSKEGFPTPVGVNRLALEALSLYTTMPGPRGLETVGFIKASRGKDAEFRWPIWDAPLTVDAIRSLLTCRLLFAAETMTQQFRDIGVAAVFCSRQIKPNQYYRNFAPSFQV